MTFTYLCFFLTLHVITVTSAGDTTWYYEIEKSCDKNCNGPREWQGNCNGDKQSPINIVTAKTKFNKDLKPFHFNGYDTENNFELSNTGHTAKLSLGGEKDITISGGGLEGTYKAGELHFHWGSSNMPGSEHSIDGERFAGELHIVHTESSSRSKPSRATTEGVKHHAVLGFFIEEGDKDNTGYEGIIQALEKIELKGSNVTVSKVNLEKLIPQAKDLERFYRYEGSLTTHPCDETVTWTLFHKTIKLGKSQLDAFYTKLHYSTDAVMVENFRPVQNLRGRTVYTSGVQAVLSHSGHLLLSFMVAYIVSTS